MTVQSMKDLQKGRSIYVYYGKKQVLFAAFFGQRTEGNYSSVQDNQSALEERETMSKEPDFLVTVVIQV